MSQSPDALAISLAEQAAGAIRGYSDSKATIAKLVLRHAKLNELCACAEALREAIVYLPDINEPQSSFVKTKAEQALASLDSTSQH